MKEQPTQSQTIAKKHSTLAGQESHTHTHTHTQPQHRTSAILQRSTLTLRRHNAGLADFFSLDLHSAHRVQRLALHIEHVIHRCSASRTSLSLADCTTESPANGFWFVGNDTVRCCRDHGGRLVDFVRVFCCFFDSSVEAALLVGPIVD